MASLSTNTKNTGNMAKLAPEKEVMRIMECPICNDIPFPPIYQCLDGHSICKKCKPKVKECPICLAKWSQARNYTLEQIILSSYHACDYKDNGCKIVEKGDSIEEHIRTCLFTPGKCPFYSYDECELTCLKLRDIKGHLISVHETDALALPTLTDRFYISEEKQKGRWIYGNSVLEFDRKSFIIDVLLNESKFYWVVLLIGMESEAKNYRAEIILNPGSGRKISWNIPVESVRNRTIASFALDETNIFKPCCSWEELKCMDNRSNERNSSITFDCKFTISKC